MSLLTRTKPIQYYMHKREKKIKLQIRRKHNH